MPADDVTMCEPEPPISEAPLPTPEDWLRLYKLADRVVLAMHSALGGSLSEASGVLLTYLYEMRPTYARLREERDGA